MVHMESTWSLQKVESVDFTWSTWSLHGVYMDSSWTPHKLHKIVLNLGESPHRLHMDSTTPCGVHVESRWNLWGSVKSSTIVFYLWLVYMTLALTDLTTINAMLWHDYNCTDNLFQIFNYSDLTIFIFNLYN